MKIKRNIIDQLTYIFVIDIFTLIRVTTKRQQMTYVLVGKIIKVFHLASKFYFNCKADLPNHENPDLSPAVDSCTYREFCGFCGFVIYI